MPTKCGNGKLCWKHACGGLFIEEEGSWTEDKPILRASIKEIGVDEYEVRTYRGHQMRIKNMKYWMNVQNFVMNFIWDLAY